MAREKSDVSIVPKGPRKRAPCESRNNEKLRGKGDTAIQQTMQLELFAGTAEHPMQRASSKGANAGADADRSAPATSEVRKPEDRTRRAWSAVVMEAIAKPWNLRSSFERVAANKGAPGPNKETIEEVRKLLPRLIPWLSESLLDGTYQPGNIRRVWIPKGDGSQRGLGIPDVVDRLVQQAVLQVLEPHYDATFHDSSHGFRRFRSCHTAIDEAKKHLENGAEWVVDIDLEKFFDKVNHQRLLSTLSHRIADGRVIELIRKMLKAKVVMPDGLTMATEEGTPQGGPLSPLLSNIVLDELDRELDRRGLKFVRYADDCNIYVRSQRAGNRVMESIRRFITDKLRLKVNEKKSAVAKPSGRHFLGFSLGTVREEGKVEVRLSERTIRRARAKLVELLPRNLGSRVEECVERLNRYLIGWIGFFRIATTSAEGSIKWLESHARRRLRAIILRQWKRRPTMFRKLVALGVSKKVARNSIYGGNKSIWRLSHTPAADNGMGIEWFARKLKLVSIVDRWKHDLKRRTNHAPVQLMLALG